MVDVSETEDGSPLARAELLAMNRWRQMQAPTVIYPALNAVTERTEVCEIDMVRPAIGDQSDSVKWRRRVGRDKKQSFYKAEMARSGSADPLDLKYTVDFDDLCGESAQWGNLRDKMALIYLDGNGVGTRLGRLVEDDLKEFSEGLRNEQARVLRVLIEEHIHQDRDWQNYDHVPAGDIAVGRR